MTALVDAQNDLRGVVQSLKKLEKAGIGLADASLALRRVSYDVGVALSELQAHERRLMALDNDLGDALLRVEALEAVGDMSNREAKEYLRDAKEIRKEEAMA